MLNKDVYTIDPKVGSGILLASVFITYLFGRKVGKVKTVRLVKKLNKR
jgi:hypothetical protein